MTSKQNLLTALHVAVGGASARGVMRAAVEELCAAAIGWSAVRDRIRATRRCSVDAIDDAIAWQAWRIAGPYLLAKDGIAILADHSADAEHLWARSRVILGTEDRNRAGLTRGEYVAWAWSNTALVEWLCQRLDVPGTIRSVQVARWAALLTGEARTALERQEARLDEITPGDLVPGSVSATFAASENRVALEVWEGPDELTPPHPLDQRLPPGVTRLRSVRGMLAEGRRMRNCVGTKGYIQLVQSGDALLFALSTSTLALLRKGGEIYQHRGFANGEPSRSEVRVAEAVSDLVRTAFRA